MMAYANLDTDRVERSNCVSPIPRRIPERENSIIRDKKKRLLDRRQGERGSIRMIRAGYLRATGLSQCLFVRT